MRSAYGLQIPSEDAELTHVGPGTPCGELLRRYWHPVCASAELTDVPRRVRILGEDLVAFRDGRGRPGLLFFRCSHRNTSLEYGRVERDGLRCCYHGWLYDVEGNVLEMPLEPAGSSLKKRVRHPVYPVQEFGGLLFAYMGPLDKMPLLPRYDVLVAEPGTLHARFGIRVGGAHNCNWLQGQENIMDVAHTMWLHTRHSVPQLSSEVWGIEPRIEYRETELGMQAVMTRVLPDGREWVVTWDMFMPMTCHIAYADDPRTEKAREVKYVVPVDNTHHLGPRIIWAPPGQDYSFGKEREAKAPINRKDTSYEYTQRFPDDKEATEAQGEITIHALEHLASSDKGVIMLRRLLREGIRAVRAGRDPKGVIRDPKVAECVSTAAGSVLRERAA